MKDKYGIDRSVVDRSENYPPKFYQVLEKLDIVMRNWVGDDMGSNGVDELCVLCSIFNVDATLYFDMPSCAKDWLYSLFHPKTSYKSHSDCGNLFSGQLGAYSHLRQYLIDNAERVTEDYLLVCKVRKCVTRADREDENNFIKELLSREDGEKEKKKWED